MRKLISLLALSVVFVACSPNEEVEPAVQKAEVQELSTAKASFDIVTNHGLVNESEELSLTNLSSDAVSYHWDFGNGETSTKAVPSFKFSMHGFYDVTLTVTDKAGNQNRFTKEVGVLCKFGGGEH